MSDDFDDRYIDVDFPDFEEFTYGDLGDPEDGIFGASYEDVVPTLTDKQVREAIEAQQESGGWEKLVSRIFDQWKEGSCTCNATAQQHEITQAKTYGIDNVIHLSSISLYKQVAESASSGSNIGRAGKAMQQVGILPLDDAANKEKFEHTMPNVGFSKSYPNGWKETAAKLRSDEYRVVTTWEGFKTALLLGPLVGGRDGHAICYTRLGYDVKKGQYFADYVNSWTAKWGNGGYGRDYESKIKAAARQATALRTIRLQSGLLVPATAV